MNQKLENEDNHPPSGLISKIKKFFRNPFFIKTQSVSEVTDFLKDAVDLNIIDKEAESIANKAIRLGNTTVKEIMVPKVDMVTFGINDEINVILEKIIEYEAVHEINSWKDLGQDWHRMTDNVLPFFILLCLKIL